MVTAEVIISELGDVSRFRNAKAICAYAGLVPAVRQSGGKKSKDLQITKEGSGLLRWALVESAWRLVNTSPKWTAVFSVCGNGAATSGPSSRWPGSCCVCSTRCSRHRPLTR